MLLFFDLFTFATNLWQWKFVTADCYVPAAFVNNQHGIQRRGQDFDFKKFVFEGYTAKRLTDEFPEISWTKRGVNKLLKNLRDTSTVDKRPGSGRPRSVCTEENVETVNDLVLSQEDKPQTHRTVCEIPRKTGLHWSSVSRIICKDVHLKCFKRRSAQELTDANCAASMKCAKLLLQNFMQSAADFVFFTDKKVFSVTNSPNNRQNDQCTQNAICLHFLPYLLNICRKYNF